MHNALRLRKEVTELLLRDFGIRGKIYQEAHEARMDDLSREKFLRVIGHYDVSPADREELESSGADTVVNSPEELLELSIRD